MTITSPIETIEISTPSKEGVLQASKWQHIRALIDPSECEELFKVLGSFYLVNTAKVCKKEEILVDIQAVIYSYREYIAALKATDHFEDQKYKACFSLALSRGLEPFYLMKVKEEAFLVKLKEPAIRMQLYSFHYIEEEKQFVSTQHRQEPISWGLEFSFPQFYQDTSTCQPIEVLKNKDNPNTKLFKMIQQWTRDFTVPAPFTIHKNKHIAPFRLGKKCFEWVNEYSTMRRHGLEILDHYANRSDNNR
jgi:hypothetical protein